MDGPSGEDDIVEGLLERAHGQVHWPDGKQRQRVDPDHDDHEHDVQHHLQRNRTRR